MIVINQKRYHRTGKSMSGYEMQGMLPKLKKQYPWLGEVNSQSLQIVCHNLADAYGKFFRKQNNFPKLKKKSSRSSFSCITNCRLEDKHVRLSKFGDIRFRSGKIPEGNIKKFTVTKRAGKYFVSLLIEDRKEIPTPLLVNQILGLDLGLIDIVTTSTGKTFSAPRLFRKTSKKLKSAQKAFCRCRKNSNRRKKASLRVSKIFMKIANQRKDFTHKITKILVSDSENQAYGIEDLNIRGLTQNRKVAKSVLDCGWGQLITFLQYKAERIGKQIIKVDRFFPSSKTCSCCGVVKKTLPLSIRIWKCDNCGNTHDRDKNAAINIAREAARNVVLERGGSVSPIVRLAVA